MNSIKGTLGWIYKGRRQCLVLLLIFVISGCARLSPIADEGAGGINPDYIFGDRRPGTDMPIIDDSDYAEYLEWKQWQDFQAYQKWKNSRGEAGSIGSDPDSD